MPTVANIGFRRIPGQSALFLDYLESKPAAMRFYAHPPNFQAVEDLARGKPASVNAHRSELAAILRRQNALIGGGSDTMANIEELAKPDAVAVVTGQQVGLFGGPLYTAYKALAAIRISEVLRGRGIRAVPVFWMECEDHDLAEVTRSSILDGEGTLHRLEFADRFFAEGTSLARPVGSLIFPESVQEAIGLFSSIVSEGPHKSQVIDSLKSIYTAGTGLADAFGRWMSRLLDGRGMVFFNPSDPAAKRLAAPVFRRALTGAAEVHEILFKRNDAVTDSGFHAQVGISENTASLFIVENGERRSLVREGDRFNLKNTDRSFSRDELLHLLERSPEAYSPNVLLRPLIQDHIFPTVAYVGGPAETAYFAQVAAMYPFFGLAMPVIWPRASFTLIEPELEQVMKTAGIGMEDCFAGTRRIAERLMESEPRTLPGSRLKTLGEEIERTLTEVSPVLASADASLGPALETARRKILHHVEGLQARFVQLETSRNAALSRKAEAIYGACYPNGVLQERELGIHNFLARHGTGILDTIYRQISLDDFDHRVISLD